MRLFVVAALLLSSCVAVEPEAVYSGGFDFPKNDSIKLRIANGGAGQSGLIKGRLTVWQVNVPTNTPQSSPMHTSKTE